MKANSYDSIRVAQVKSITANSPDELDRKVNQFMIDQAKKPGAAFSPKNIQYMDGATTPWTAVITYICDIPAKGGVQR